MNALPEDHDRPSIFVPASDASCALPSRGPQKTMRNSRSRKQRKNKSRRYRR
jgi:hypothetical protein